VVRRGGALEGVEAVVDKDLATALLATGTGAGQIVLVTGVPGVYLDFDTPEAVLISNATPDDLEQWHRQGHFPAGTMGPKVEAAIRFVRETGGRATICQPADLADAVEGRAGTTVQ
jgi:carbamate kinase